MKLYSHGRDSDLREHLAEVMLAAETPEERVLCACHDLGKATAAWQAYILGNNRESPHRHAAAGGLFAALVLLELNGPAKEKWALIALHAGAAHHTDLQELNTDSLNGLSLVAVDRQVGEFILDPEYGIASLLPEVPAEVLLRAWEKFRRMAPPASRERFQFKTGLKRAVSPEERLKIYLHCRSLLGRLCLLDHASAARQSGKPVEVREWRARFPAEEFKLRPAREFKGAETPVNRLRSCLRREFLQTVEKEGIFYFIDAPTGLGKTEAMLCGAELLRQREGLSRIVFAVPQLSIADQVFEEYFPDCRAQIWNSRRRDKTEIGNAQTPPEDRRGNGSDAEALSIEEHPFQMPYNVTTFNQVLLAMCHPNRNRCIRGLGLRDAVVILDEFHKLPQVILPFFFRIAREYARLARCRFILGSATPLEPFRFWDLEDSCRIPPEATAPIYRAAEIDNRRLYRSMGFLTLQELGTEIEAFQQESDRNLLVVVNLIGEGSWPLRQRFQQAYNPWRQLEELKTPGTGRIMVWLDGLVPPLLRRDLITACRDAMRHRPVTLVSTQMIEVGVDLDFDAAFIDYQGLAATMQRGGRVGRNGRETPCEVGAFALVCSNGDTSFEQLIEVRKNYSIRLRQKPFDAIFKQELKFLDLEIDFFKEWGERFLHDSELAASLSEFQREVFAGLTAAGLLEQLFRIDVVGMQSLGATFEKAQFIAELFDSEKASEIIVVESQEVYDELSELNRRIKSQTSTGEDRKRFLTLQTDRTVAPADRIRSELGLVPCGWIDYPEPIEVFRVDSMVW